jgi:hypothetical protein
MEFGLREKKKKKKKGEGVFFCTSVRLGLPTVGFIKGGVV